MNAKTRWTVPVLCSGNMFDSTLGPVTAWMGDRLWTGKPPRRAQNQAPRPTQPLLLNQAPRPTQPLLLGWNEYPAKGGKVQAYRMIH